MIGGVRFVSAAVVSGNTMEDILFWQESTLISYPELFLGEKLY